MASTSRDSQEIIAKKTWELENNIRTVNTVDAIFKYDQKQQQDILAAKPWEKEYVCIIFLINYNY
jgi:COP9 signalosome complex subunit 5